MSKIKTIGILMMLIISIGIASANYNPLSIITYPQTAWSRTPGFTDNIPKGIVLTGNGYMKIDVDLRPMARYAPGEIFSPFGVIQALNATYDIYTVNSTTGVQRVKLGTSTVGYAQWLASAGTQGHVNVIMPVNIPDSEIGQQTITVQESITFTTKNSTTGATTTLSVGIGTGKYIYQVSGGIQRTQNPTVPGFAATFGLAGIVMVTLMLRRTPKLREYSKNILEGRR